MYLNSIVVTTLIFRKESDLAVFAYDKPILRSILQLQGGIKDWALKEKHKSLNFPFPK